jgi:hypothetical protein
VSSYFYVIFGDYCCAIILFKKIHSLLYQFLFFVLYLSSLYKYFIRWVYKKFLRQNRYLIFLVLCTIVYNTVLIHVQLFW